MMQVVSKFGVREPILKLHTDNVTNTNKNYTENNIVSFEILKYYIKRENLTDSSTPRRNY